MRAPVFRSVLETADGVVMGTAGYMSPEQVRGEAVDARSDIFSLGAILFEMLSGRPAFTRENAADTMAAILKDDSPALATTAAPALERIVLRCLEKSRESRFQSARDLAFALECLPGTATARTRDADARSRAAVAAPVSVGRGRLPAHSHLRSGAHAVGAVAKSACRHTDRPQRAAGHRRLARRVHQRRVRADDRHLAARGRSRVSSTEKRGRNPPALRATAR